MSSHSDYIRIDWQSMDAARKKYRAAVVKAEKQPGAPLVHTLYKLGQFLDEATYGAFRLSEERLPDTPEGLTS